MAAAIIDDIKRCEGCAAHYSARIAATLHSPDARRWCTIECSRRKPTEREQIFSSLVQNRLAKLCAETKSAEWDKLLPAQRSALWAKFVAQFDGFDRGDRTTSAPRREPAIRGHSTGL